MLSGVLLEWKRLRAIRRGLPCQHLLERSGLHPYEHPVSFRVYLERYLLFTSALLPHRNLPERDQLPVLPPTVPGQLRMERISLPGSGPGCQLLQPANLQRHLLR